MECAAAAWREHEAGAGSRGHARPNPPRLLHPAYFSSENQGNRVNTHRPVMSDRARPYGRVEGRGTSIKLVRRTQNIVPSAHLLLDPRRTRAELALERRG